MEVLFTVYRYTKDLTRGERDALPLAVVAETIVGGSGERRVAVVSIVTCAVPGIGPFTREILADVPGLLKSEIDWTRNHRPAGESVVGSLTAHERPTNLHFSVPEIRASDAHGLAEAALQLFGEMVASRHLPSEGGSLRIDSYWFGA